MQKVHSGGQLRLLNLVISEACNFGCSHCLHSCSTGTSTSHGQKKLMDWETAQKAIDEYAAVMQIWDTHPLDVHFGSAEPLLNWSVLEQAIYYTRGLDPNAKLSVNTNLSLITKSMIKVLKANEIYISTSLDGPPAGNDAIRTFKDGGATFNAIVSKFGLLEEMDYPLDGFSITLNDLNFDVVNPDFIDWAYQRGMKGIATDVDMINTAQANRDVNNCVLKLMELRFACQARGMENFGSWTTSYDHLVNEPIDNMPTFCRAAKGQNISVNPEGWLFICGHTTTPIGRIDHLEEALSERSPYCQLVKSRLPGEDPECMGCEIEGLCAGQCQITREVSRATGNNRDKTMCELYRNATRVLLKEKLDQELEGG
ncbi:MAG: radical SAM protein [Patescibacteria group bacterium]